MLRLSYRSGIIAITCILLTVHALAQSAWVPGEVLVMLKKDARITDVQRVLATALPERSTIKETKPLGKDTRYHKIVMQGEAMADQDFEKLVARMPGVEATSLNYKLKFYAEPNDAQYGSQWNMEDINVEPVWDVTTGGTMANGKRIGVGISDEAIQTNHPDLQDNIWPNSPAQSGGSEHGTEVASVVGAVGNNAIGIAGVNWDVEILSGTDLSDLSEVIEQFELAISLREQFNNSNGTGGLMVVSMTASWGIEDPQGCDGFTFPLFTDMAAAGIILVTSGPNEPVSIESGNNFPSNCALDEHFVVTSYGPANQTPFAFGPNTVHLLVPGIDIPVATAGGSYTVVQGNSFAIPMLAGAVALLYSIPCPGFADLVMNDPVAARTMVKNAILDNTAPFPGGNALTITGGKLDVFAAYQALMAQCPACDTLTMTLNTPAGNNAQYALENGLGVMIAQGTGGTIQFCAAESCFNATVVEGASQPLDGTFDVSFQGTIVHSGTIVSGALEYTVGTPLLGCTDPGASNYNANATCDDGSCCFSNPLIVYLIAADQVASGTAQLTVEAGGNTLYNGPVDIAYVPDAELSYGSVTVCSPTGCLQLNAQEVDVALQPNGLAQPINGTFTEYSFPTGQPTTIPVGIVSTEVCDGIDNDCDGLIDEDFIWYLDADGDGWGVESTAQVLCAPPSNGAVQIFGDCDDTDPAINPAMPDGCATADGIDNNCEGNIDEGDLLAWYPDLDGDGFGDEIGGVLACTAPPDHVEAFGDCDDADNAVFPGASELCDGLDNDCDGTTDEDFIWYVDVDGDGLGDDATAQPSCVPLPGGVQVGGDCDDTDPTKQNAVILNLVAADGVSEGTAHYIVTQGSTVIEGDMVLSFDEVSFGEAAICLGQGCFSVTIEEVDVPLTQDSYIQTADGLGGQQFLTFDGFFGNSGEPLEELCDGLDNDCDGSIDEDFFWYTDADGDDVGDFSTPQFSCTPISGAVQVSGDCNDADPNLTTIGASCNDGDPSTIGDIVRPNCTCLGFPQGNCPEGEIEDCNGNCAPMDWIGDGFCDDGSFEHNGVAIFFDCPQYFFDGGDCEAGCFTEICDGFDNDCDGEVDEDFTWYTDADGDGYGDPTTAEVHCTPPQGLVLIAGDCDDSDASINPGATDLCDGIDRNCDGDLPGTNGTEVYSPDWTAMAATGETVHLYDLLGQGKTVVLDLFAAWCAPSQQMLSANFLQDWNAHMGPDGTDQIRIVAIAVDQNAGSVVPFINSAQWPVIVDDAESFGPLYNAIGMYNNAVPTLLMICPDRSVTMLYGGPDLLPYTGQFQYDPPAATALLNAQCACRNACITNVGCMDVNACNYDPLASCPGPCASAQEWFVDNDGDGIGTTSLGISCTQPANSAGISGDCDDTNAAVSTGLTLFVLTEDPSDFGTAHYLIRQGSTIIEGDLDLPAVTEGVGELPVCIGSGCYTISITQNDVPLYEESFLDFQNAPEDQVAFSTIGGYQGGGTSEICDGIDNDCNGLVDDGFTPQYADNDGDGFGDLLQPLPCDTPGVANPDDCDDTNADIYPGAPEICGDGVDNDCNGIVDDQTTWYGDADGDGFGISASTLQSCEQPMGYAPLSGDCDDTDPGVYPLAGPGIGCASCSTADQQYIQEQYSQIWNLTGLTMSNTALGLTGQAAWNALLSGLQPFLSEISPSCQQCVVERAFCAYTSCATACVPWLLQDGDSYPGTTPCNQCAALGGCNVAFNTCVGVIDQDGDGYLNVNDCDDLDPAINPYADELCDGIDNDCDGQIDEDFTLVYTDNDGDGFGDPNSLVPCGTGGAVPNNSDCDDTNNSVYPNAPELIDGIDNDCDGEVDEFQCNDMDGDGTTDCDGDCDDTDPNVFPGAQEICGDGLDNDCNGIADDQTTWYEDSDGDGYGISTSTLLACEQPAGYAYLSGDCDDTDPGVYPLAGPGIGCASCSTADQQYIQEQYGQIWNLTGLTMSNTAPGLTGQAAWNALLSGLQPFLSAIAPSCQQCVVERAYCAYTSCATECVPWLLQDGDSYPGTTTCNQCVALGGCNVAFNACVGLIDQDGDGYLSTNDCNDLDPTINPYADELCDGLDNDCDGLIDLDFTLVFADTDGDGYGDPNVPVVCGTPGAVVNDQDCDDTDAQVFPGAAEVCNGIDDDCDGHVDENCVLVSVRVFLEGPYNIGSGQMNDGMRALGLVPTIEPYSGMGYTHVGAGGETTSPAMLALSGNDAVVDWVVLELRDVFNPSLVVSTRSALLQRDGDVVDVDGSPSVQFNAPPDNYHVAIRHRNHLGAMTLDASGLSSNSVNIDFTLAEMNTYGTNARRSMTGAMVLWAGDVTFDGLLQYTGENNDRDPILNRIGGIVPTNTVTDYHATDVNLDGTVRYTGEDNDRDLILLNIGGIVPTNTRLEQLP